jgi:hypothetical protein
MWAGMIGYASMSVRKKRRRRSTTRVNATRVVEESRHYIRMSELAWDIVRCFVE